MAEELDVEFIIFNQEISARMINNINELIDVTLLDQNMLVLDIFKQRAKSKSAKLQVEIAHIEYQLPRLVGSYKHLSGQVGSFAGGLATRGLGETKLELEKRKLNRQLHKTKKKLKQLNTVLKTQSSQRDKSDIFKIALVGYTNSGKSTLFNQFLNLSTDKKPVFAKDMLFATLDTTLRKIQLDSNVNFLLSDTIGFIDNLHHSLVEAFKTTLSEVIDADLLLHIIDASNPNYLRQKEVVNNTLLEIGANLDNMIEVYNKKDLLEENDFIDHNLLISALDKDDINYLIKYIKPYILSDYQNLTLNIPYSDASQLSQILDDYPSEIIKEDDKGYIVDAYIKESDIKYFKQYM